MENNGNRLLNKEQKKSKTSGITLIALVVTIIVLLILAGISISMLTGNNGILNRAGEAKEKNDRMGIIEQARIDILDKIAENKGENITDSQFREVLEKYFTKESIPDEFPEDLSEVELTSLNERHKILASEIYDGRLKTLSPGLYYAGTDNLYMSWEEITKPTSSIIDVTNDGVLSRRNFNIGEIKVKMVIANTVTSISSLAGISQLEEIVIPSSVISVGSTAFTGCSSLKEIYLGENITIIGSGKINFGYCNNLTKVTILSSGGIAAGSFDGNQSLTSVKLGEKVTSIDAYAFRGCSNLSKIEIERTEHSSLIAIGENAFLGTSIKQILLPDSLQTIRCGCFSRMRKSFMG